MTRYISPRTRVTPVQLQSSILASSSMPIEGGDEQIYAW